MMGLDQSKEKCVVCGSVRICDNCESLWAAKQCPKCNFIEALDRFIWQLYFVERNRFKKSPCPLLKRFGENPNVLTNKEKLYFLETDSIFLNDYSYSIKWFRNRAIESRPPHCYCHKNEADKTSNV